MCGRRRCGRESARFCLHNHVMTLRDAYLNELWTYILLVIRAYKSCTATSGRSVLPKILGRHFPCTLHSAATVKWTRLRWYKEENGKKPRNMGQNWRMLRVLILAISVSFFFLCLVIFGLKLKLSLRSSFDDTTTTAHVQEYMRHPQDGYESAFLNLNHCVAVCRNWLMYF